jgi:hypothetical protein
MMKKTIPKYVLILFGILSIVPVLGGILGLGFILAGLIVYKNKTLVIVGCLGVLITTSSIMYLKYYGNHRGPFDSSRIMVAQKRMNFLIKEVEFYKLNKGHYPSELIEIKKESRTVNIHDPVQDVNNDLSDKSFYYKPAYAKYYLFSKGFDGQAFTKDDILPEISILDSSKVGIILH